MHSLHHKEIDVNVRGSYAAMKEKARCLDKRYQGTANINVKKVRDPHMVIIRNKFTKEVVDLEVSIPCTYLVLKAQNLRRANICI